MDLEQLADEVRERHRAKFKRAWKKNGLIVEKKVSRMAYRQQNEKFVNFGRGMNIRKLTAEEIESFQERIQELSEGARSPALFRLGVPR